MSRRTRCSRRGAAESLPPSLLWSPRSRLVCSCSILSGAEPDQLRLRQLARRSFSGGGSEGGILNYQLALISLSDLRRRWEWDPLRNNLWFQKILAGPEPKTIH